MLEEGGEDLSCSAYRCALWPDSLGPFQDPGFHSHFLASPFLAMISLDQTLGFFSLSRLGSPISAS